MPPRGGRSFPSIAYGDYSSVGMRHDRCANARKPYRRKLPCQAEIRADKEKGNCEMEVFKRGTGILPVKNVPFPTKCRKESRARCRSAELRPKPVPRYFATPSERSLESLQSKVYGRKSVPFTPLLLCSPCPAWLRRACDRPHCTGVAPRRRCGQPRRARWAVCAFARNRENSRRAARLECRPWSP